MAPNDPDSEPHRDLSSAGSLVPRTPSKSEKVRRNGYSPYPTPLLAKIKPIWTSSDLDTPGPDPAGGRGSSKRARDEEVVYVDSGSDSEDLVQTPTKKKARKAGDKGNSSTKRGDTSNGRKVGSWTKEEIRALWDAMFVPPTRIDWEAVSSQVPRRDKLSCSNKWRYDLLPKVQAFIDSLGE